MILAISGDQVGHLLWRLSNGEMLTKRAPRAIVVAIGTNDLGWARRQALRPEGAEAGAATASAERQAALFSAAAKNVVVGVREVVKRLHAAYPSASIVIQALLPRADRLADGDAAPTQPSAFTPYLDGINVGLKAVAGSIPNARFADCNAVFFVEGGELNLTRLPDGLHPSEEGIRAMHACLKPIVAKAHDEAPAGGKVVDWRKKKGRRGGN